MFSFPQATAAHRGWTDENYIFYQEQKIIMPEHNVTLHAIFLYYHNLIYDSGNADGIVGVKQIFSLDFVGQKWTDRVNKIS